MTVKRILRLSLIRGILVLPGRSRLPNWRPVSTCFTGQIDHTEYVLLPNIIHEILNGNGPSGDNSTEITRKLGKEAGNLVEIFPIPSRRGHDPSLLGHPARHMGEMRQFFS